jgi:hypothetical protein
MVIPPWVVDWLEKAYVVLRLQSLPDKYSVLSYLHDMAARYPTKLLREHEIKS